MVLFKKVNSKWRMYIDYTNLNQICLKDYFILPWINQLVDVIARFGYLSSLDTYSGYHQILMDPEDKEKNNLYNR